MGQIADLIIDVLEGRAQPEALGPSWAADLGMPIHKKACAILDMPKDVRRATIENHPPAVAKLLAAEVKRLYTSRK